ncbi:hypothetical protein [Streptococcus hyointestinalis]|uniref:hypothetical protein n=1 Tax=Streptococcus hyointestinalis TaxID=1337 RepID=UPI0013DFF594|nr:hypothetical protein [Streptococcus hyointestinalis]
MTIDELRGCLNSIDDYERTILHSTVGSFKIDNWIEFDSSREMLVFVQDNEIVALKISSIFGYSTLPKTYR